MIDETLFFPLVGNIVPHMRHGGSVSFVRGKPRCKHCGHRLTVDGVPPVQTRSLPIREWPIEIIDRKRARS